MAQILNGDSIDFAAYMAETDTQTRVRSASDWIAELKARLTTRRTERQRFLPWPKARDNFQFRDGEVTLWVGQNGHGKSMLIGQVALSLMGQGDRVCIANMEAKPLVTLQRLARQYCGTNPFLPEFQGDRGVAAITELYDDFGDFTRDGLWLYDQTGFVDVDAMVGMAKYCATQYGVKHIVVDNLAKCIANEDDFNGQKAFVDAMSVVARDFDVHVHIVHHARKGASENAVPDKHDAKGSGAIVDQVDNFFVVWRNKPKEDDIRAKGDMAKLAADPDHYLLCRKQRNYEGSADGEPTIKLWFDRDSTQLLAANGDEPMFFHNWPHERTAA